MAELSSYPKLTTLTGTEQLILDDATPTTKNITTQNLANALAMLAATSWIPVSFSSGWTNNGSPYQSVQYKKSGDLVYIRGLATSLTNAWSSYPTIFVLPAGYRPLASLAFGQMASSALIWLEVHVTGEVLWSSYGAGSGWISLDGLVFSVA